MNEKESKQQVGEVAECSTPAASTIKSNENAGHESVCAQRCALPVADMPVDEALPYADLVVNKWPAGESQLDRAALKVLAAEVRRLREEGFDEVDRHEATKCELGKLREHSERRLQNARAKVHRLRDELERERMRLAGCGVAATGHFDDCHPDYDSDSLQNTLRLYAQKERLRTQLERVEALLLRDNQHTTTGGDGRDYRCIWPEDLEAALRGE